MAFQMIASILVCVFLGHFLDQKLGVQKSSLDHSNSFPLYTFIGTIVGVATSLYLALKSIKK
jgi:F0F1-type ATP synthase assembly protein I